MYKIHSNPLDRLYKVFYKITNFVIPRLFINFYRVEKLYIVVTKENLFQRHETIAENTLWRKSAEFYEKRARGRETQKCSLPSEYDARDARSR